jgi:hypothetical protein
MEGITGQKVLEAKHKPLSRAMNRRVDIPEQQTRQPLGDRDHVRLLPMSSELDTHVPNHGDH